VDIVDKLNGKYSKLKGHPESEFLKDASDLICGLRLERDELKAQLEQSEERVAELVGALEEIREIYAGMEGFIAERASEAYLQQTINNMWKACIKGLATHKGESHE
jgi:hypothetical protein